MLHAPIARHPTEDRRVSKRQTSLSHHVDEIARAELVAQIYEERRDIQPRSRPKSP